jgi:hypothetical protein
MDKRKCAHCGYKFRPKEEDETVCEACRIQLRDDSTDHKCEFEVKQLGSLEIKGKLLLSIDKVVFKPEEVYFRDKKMEIPLSKIRDVRFTTEKEISALNALLLGSTWAILFQKRHNLLTIDYEDDFGIVQHPIFEGADMESAIVEISEIRRNERSRLKEEKDKET